MDKACFQHDMPYGDFKDLPRRTAFKVLCNKVFNIEKKKKKKNKQKNIMVIKEVLL